ncbi:glutathione peroxidase [Bdellovibrio bacteriovorus]|uniref:Glutathione peroxidase n=1 Tax=Bdellovibrio bacteriovorus TaxID=959 RepID=A0A150WPR8_BDEBC|nr:glutathione peroxidase [Bdellovibrio bacteriovorus]KYG66420.1 glutathione peroxidase [Bdellovibrio bacteriovorus]
MAKNVYDFAVTQMGGKKTTLADYKGQVMLLVNTASKCGLTPQYEGLEELYKEYKSQGLQVLGFPANEFLAQEPGSNSEIQEFCKMKFGIDFPMFEKVVVKGEGQHPLFNFLTTTRPETTMKPGGSLMEKLKAGGLLTGKPEDIKWNFEKFLINRKGELVGRFSPEIAPQDPILVDAIKKELASN